MEKATLGAIALAIVLIAGVVFVSAALSEDSTQSKQGSKIKYSQEPQPVCGSQTCNNQCGGNCGIPSCGCRK